MNTTKRFLEEIGFEFTEDDIDEQLAKARSCKRRGDWVGGISNSMAALIMALAMDDMQKQIEVGKKIGEMNIAEGDTLMSMAEILHKIVGFAMEDQRIFSGLKKWVKNGVFLENIVTWFRGTMMRSDVYLKGITEAGSLLFGQMLVTEMLDSSDDFFKSIVTMNKNLERFIYDIEPDVLEILRTYEDALRGDIDLKDSLEKTHEQARKVGIPDEYFDKLCDHTDVFLRCCSLLAGAHFILHSGNMTDDQHEDLYAIINGGKSNGESSKISENPFKAEKLTSIFAGGIEFSKN